MLEIRLFRFDLNSDILSYFKPYVYENPSFATLKDLLIDIKGNDPYFSFDDVKFIKINGYLCSIDSDFAEILKYFGDELKISPLCQKRAKKDLIINNDDFCEYFAKFGGFESEKEKYLGLEPLFYTNYEIVENTDFWGNSFFVFAKYLIDTYPECEKELLEMAKNQLIYYEKPLIFGDDLRLGASVEFFKNLLDFKEKDESKFVDFPQEIDSKIAKFRLENFNVAVYNDENLENIIRNFGAKIVNFDKKNQNYGEKFIQTNEDFAIKLGGEILFGAYDSGADFLVVNDKNAFKFLDENTAKFMEYFNREIDNFYILNANELLDLVQGKPAPSTKNHKLKVLI